MTTTPADQLRAAAEKLRDLAAAAQDDLETADYWAGYDKATAWRDGHVNGFGGVSSEYVAVLPPSVGVALADWLEAEAQHRDAVDIGQPLPSPRYEHALAVAGQVLGTTTEQPVAEAAPVVDRAAILREAADAVETDARERHDRSYSDNRIFEWKGARAASDRLRRLADEAQQPTPAVTEEAVAEALTDTEQQFLAYALHLADDQMTTRGDEFDDDDRAALVKLQRLAKAGCTCGNVNESWIETPHAADCAAIPTP